MGHGVAQVAAAAGYQVLAIEAKPEALEVGMKRCVYVCVVLKLTLSCYGNTTISVDIVSVCGHTRLSMAMLLFNT